MSITDWLLVTGQPGCGKTTAVKNMVKCLEECGFECRGFHAEKVVEGESRTGFDIVTIPAGERDVLSRKGGAKGWPKTGAYSVDVERFERLALASLAFDSDVSNKVVFVLDEIGRMELHYKEFPGHVRSLLEKGVRLVGAITAPRYGHRVPFCDEVAAAAGLQVRSLKKSNRDNVLEGLLKEIRQRWAAEDGDAKSDKRPSKRAHRKR